MIKVVERDTLSYYPREKAESRRRRFSLSSGIHEIRLNVWACRYGPKGRKYEKRLKAGEVEYGSKGKKYEKRLKTGAKDSAQAVKFMKKG